MVKCLLVILVAGVLTGCSTPPSMETTVDEFATQSAVHSNTPFDEELLIKSGNHEGLIAFYKRNLTDRDHISTRVKLSSVYLEHNDPESALFTLSTISSEKSDYRVYYIRASSYHALAQWEAASHNIEQALKLKPDSGEALNLAGVIAAENNDLNIARVFFNQARTNMYDDTKVKINLSMLDVIEGNYEGVVNRLMPFYKNKAFITSDDIVVLLSLALAKTGQKKSFESLLSHDYNKTSIDNMYNYLANLTLY